MLSDEEVAKIELELEVRRNTGIPSRSFVQRCVNTIEELLADRAECIEERIRDKEAVIAKIEKDIDWLENVVRPTYKPGKFQNSYHSGWLIAYNVILAFIRNPKEAILTPQPNPEARNSPGHTHA